MKLLLLFFSLALAQEILFDLQEYRSPLFFNFCNVSLTQDQLGWSANQPYIRWTNITLLLGGKALQLTARDQDGKLGWGESSYVIYFDVDEIGYQQFKIKFSINYWGRGFTLYYATIPSIYKCQNVPVQPGTPPS